MVTLACPPPAGASARQQAPSLSRFAAGSCPTWVGFSLVGFAARTAQARKTDPGYNGAREHAVPPQVTSERNVETDSALAPSPRTDRITRWLLIAIGVYSALLVSFLNLVILNSGNVKDRAIFLMADGMILLWIIVGGSLTPMLRKRLVPRLAAIPIGWRVRFVLLSTVMALIEEAITTSMTNCAPLLGTTPEEAHITASTNYFTVVCFHSVVVFVPMFIAWAWMLSRWDFSPLKVLLLFGITGSIAEAGINPTSLIGGFWVFVYGLMVYLPACTVPTDRPAKQPRWWHYPLALFLPLVAAIPVVPVIVLLRQWLGIQFLPGVE